MIGLLVLSNASMPSVTELKRMSFRYFAMSKKRVRYVKTACNA